MASTEYTLSSSEWTACGAADDATVQVLTDTQIIVTTDTSLPGSGVTVGLRLSKKDGEPRHIALARVGKTIYARAIPAEANTAIIVVER